MSRRLAAIQDVVPAGASAIVGRSPAMLRMRRTIEMVSASDAAVLIAGETGSGKELVARAIHASSNRRDRPFVAINCGSLSENLLASELFGAERGAYTSATSSRPGLFVAAHSGTLFLDEVGDMPPAMQVALLRVLETSEIRPVGSTKSRRVDVRILAASHRDLLHLVRVGTFRDDLRYRLEVIRVEVPPLRERLDDMQELCEYLLREARRMSRPCPSAAIRQRRLRRSSSGDGPETFVSSNTSWHPLRSPPEDPSSVWRTSRPSAPRTRKVPDRSHRSQRSTVTRCVPIPSGAGCVQRRATGDRPPSCSGSHDRLSTGTWNLTASPPSPSHPLQRPKKTARSGGALVILRFVLR